MVVGVDGFPFFYPPKVNGWSYFESANPKDDDEVDWPDEATFLGGGIVHIEPDGPTDFGVGKNIAKFKDSIGGCNMDFEATASRGYAAFPDDPRDIEYKCMVKFVDIDPDEGFSLSCCTGHHTSDKCCQGFAYMGNLKPGASPCEFRFRKEMWHVSYHNSPEGIFTDNRVDFKLNGHGYVGFGFTRYNKPNTTDRVVLEMWFNNDPVNHPVDGWFMLKRIEDFPGNGWGDDGDECNGDSDQVGTWSGCQNRAKTNSTQGYAEFQKISLREIDVTRSFDDVPPPDPGGGGGGGTPPPGGGTGIPAQVSPVISYILINANVNGYPSFKPPMTGIQSMFLALAEDLAETMTDPNPSAIDGPIGWRGTPGPGTDNEGEIGDAPCDHDFGAEGNQPLVHTFPDGVMVEPYWSNKDKACSLDLSANPDDPNPPPGTTTTTALNFTVATTGDFQHELADTYGVPIAEFVISVLGEETIETQTDPFDLDGDEHGWHRATENSCDQIGEAPCNPFDDDKCGDGDPDWVFEYSDGFFNEAYWSNALHNCTIPHHLETAKSKSSAKAEDLVYHGGRIIRKPIMNLIFWGEEWQDQTDPSMNHLISLVKNKMLNDHKDFFDGIDQYSNCGAPVFGEALLYDETNPPKTVTSDAAYEVILAALKNRFTNIPDLVEDIDNINIVVFLPKRCSGVANEWHTARTLVLTNQTEAATIDDTSATDSTMDNNGIAWLEATGEIIEIANSRDDSDDFRWSKVIEDIGLGYETSYFVKANNINLSNGHTAMKLGGPNHKEPCGDTMEGGQCCCWYDLGIRSNGDIQTQIERPHPQNTDVDCDDCTMTDIGVTMEDHWIGIKHILHPEVVGGDVNHGGIRIKMYVSVDAIKNGVPTNDWQLVFNTLDTGQWLDDYDWPLDQEMEMRLSGMDKLSDLDMYKDKVFVRRIGTGGGSGGGGGEPIPPCPDCRITYHGGRIMKTPKVNLIFWGQAWDDRVTSPTKNECITWFRDKLLGTDKAYFNNLNQYGGIGVPVFGEAVTNLTYPVPSATNISEEDARLVINNTIETGLIPYSSATVDFNNTIYIVFMPIDHVLWHPENGVKPDATHDSYKPVLTVSDTGAPDQPTDVIVVQFAFTLKADMNVYTSTACSLGTSDPGGGGSGGVSVFYDVSDTSNEKEIANESSSDFRTQITEKVNSSSAPMKGITPHQADVLIKKVGTGSPGGGSTPVIHCKIWDSSGAVVYDSPTTFVPNTLTTSFVAKTFDFSTNTHALNVGDRIGIEHLGDGTSDYIVLAYSTSEGIGSTGSYVVHKEGSTYENQTGRRLSMKLWQ